MTSEPNAPDPVNELRSALAEADAEHPPGHLLRSVLDSALEARPAGRSAQEEPEISAREAFVRSTKSLRATLSALDDEDWEKHAIRGLDVRGLVGHLIGVEEAFCASLAHDPHHDPDADHVLSTDRFVDAQKGRVGRLTYAAWCDASERTLQLVESTGIEGPPEDVFALHGLRLPLDSLLAVRSFELWTHEEDIRKATGRGPATPDTPTLQLMTDLAFEFLPTALKDVGESKRIRFVLTGPGGQTWQSSDTDPGSTRTWDLRIVMPAVDFCRVVANRVDAGSSGPHVEGDGDLVPAVFAAVSSLALD
jgi:uncharacterized protein (TIGR03083 family)